jgi:hypothetical protein
MAKQLLIVLFGGNTTYTFYLAKLSIDKHRSSTLQRKQCKVYKKCNPNLAYISALDKIIKFAG